MSGTGVTAPGDYRIMSAIISPAPGSEIERRAVDIRAMIPSMTITESIHTDCISGTARIIDSAGLLEGYPLRGEEILSVTVEDALNNSVTYHFYLYRIENVQINEANDGLTYHIHFASVHRFYSDLKRIVAPYEDTISNIAKDIFDKFYDFHDTSDLDKPFHVEDTDGVQRLIIPRMTPVQAMKFLESRAYNPDSPTCSYKFFERPDGFYFVTDEWLYHKSKQQDIKYQLTYSNVIAQSNDTFMARMANLDNLVFPLRVDTFDDLHQGTYFNKVLSIDINQRTVNLTEPAFSYSDRESRLFSGETALGSGDPHSRTFINNVLSRYSAEFMMIRDYADDLSGQLRGEQHIPEIASNRMIYQKHMSNIGAKGGGPGRLDIKCGDFVELMIAEFKHAGAERGVNKQVSGLYMVDGVTRTFERDTYRNSYSFSKGRWTENIDASSGQYSTVGTLV
jgi:hypothetical protein